MKAFKTKIQAHYLIAAATMEVFRSVKDIWPKQIDHRYHGEGVFGRGTYYALREDDSLSYVDGRYGGDVFYRFAFMFRYRLTPRKPLRLNPLDALGISSYNGDLIQLSPRGAKKLKTSTNASIPRQGLGDFTAKKGYDCLILTSDWEDPESESSHVNEVDGGDQVLIPLKSSLQPTPLEFDLLLPEETDEDSLDAIQKAVGKTSSVQETPFPVLSSIPIAKLSGLDRMLTQYTK